MSRGEWKKLLCQVNNYKIVKKKLSDRTTQAQQIHTNLPLAYVMVLLMTWCITETVFSQAVCGKTEESLDYFFFNHNHTQLFQMKSLFLLLTFRSLGWWWVQANNKAANRSPVPTNTASTLGMFMQIFWMLLVPSLFTTWGRHMLVMSTWLVTTLKNTFREGNSLQENPTLPILWLPRATKNGSPYFEGRSVLVKTTVSGPMLCSNSITWRAGLEQE